MTDLAREARVSVATVDRVLSGRLPVREATAMRVLEAAERIDFRATALLKKRLVPPTPRRRLGFVLQKPDDFYRRLGEELDRACRELAGKEPRIDFVADLSPTSLADRMLQMAGAVEALGVVCVDHPLVSEAVSRLKERGVPVFALVSDLSADMLAGYVGRDNRKEGRTAAWLIAQAAPHEGEVAILVGTHRYICQETAEISFRAYFREHARGFTLLEPLLNLDDARLAYSAVRDLFAKRKDLVGLYSCGGGMSGVIAAAREAGAAQKVAIVGHELYPRTREALMDGTLTAIMSTPSPTLAETAVRAMLKSLTPGAGANDRQMIVPFDLFLPTNI
jgi:LacI family transcriptional regulator